MSDPEPALVYVRAKCPKCGARTLKQAETMCRPTLGIDDEYTCPAGENEDAAGFLRQPTTASIKAQDDWHGREAARQNL